jgi:hypothetical protein
VGCLRLSRDEHGWEGALDQTKTKFTLMKSKGTERESRLLVGWLSWLLFALANPNRGWAVLSELASFW